MLDRIRRLFAAGGGAELTPELGRRIRESFDASSADEDHFPSTIDPRIFHVRLIARILAESGARTALDLGCGKGRFAKVLAGEIPDLRITASDLSPVMLGFVPATLDRCAATMTSLPFATGAFDAVYATESLEHAVDIETAVGEMCRVVRPGGRIVVIDKNKDHWGRLQTPEWERWFTRTELERMLAKHCRSVSSRFISYWEDVEPDGLFLAWTAEK